MMVPNYVRIRIPQIVFKASEDGFNIRNLYNSVDEYVDSYQMCLILIKTNNDQVFGVFLDMMPFPNSQQFQGGHDSFVFTVRPNLEAFYSTQKNDFILMAALDYMAVGAGGKGPALRIDDLLKDGNTYVSDTFENKLLHGRTEGKFLNDFKVQDLEMFIV